MFAIFFNASDFTNWEFNCRDIAKEIAAELLLEGQALSLLRII